MAAGAADDMPVPDGMAHEFLDAAKNGQFDKVARMIEANPQYPKLVDVMPCGRWSALHQAAFWGDSKVVLYLLEKGASPGLRTVKENLKASQIADNKGHEECAGILKKLTFPVMPRLRHVPRPPKEQLLALAMGLHERLGAKSPARLLPGAAVLPRVYAFLNEAPVLCCFNCDWRLSGLRCCGFRPPSLQVSLSYADSYYPKVETLPGATLPVVSSGCGALLVPDGQGLACPWGHGRVEVKCCNNSMAPVEVVDARRLPRPEPLEKKYHMTTCDKCGWSVDRAICCSAAHAAEPLMLIKNGAIERMMCAHAWSCPQGCGRKDRGGLFCNGSGHCDCKGSMQMHQYVEDFGPPIN
eukprot:TRINITY_DN5668_c0_g1_i1.p1 TRINITY_DN5668_c0_g1~~TRINITY_DN5668_c0_g1_i1.p1  ORF type:complete len:354 (-),score=59.97 TRINITY_DN5668_c0_g1_i1:112-1173(-)